MDLIKRFEKLEYRTADSRKMSYLLASLMVVFSVSQLFTFEEFVALFAGFNIFDSGQFGFTLAILLVISEVLSLVFILNIKTSSLMKILGMILTLLVPIMWLIVSVYLISQDVLVDNIGFLGTVIDMSFGVGSVLFSFALLVLSLWIVWGLWPGVTSKK